LNQVLGYIFYLSMILSENRFPLFGIMLRRASLDRAAARAYSAAMIDAKNPLCPLCPLRRRRIAAARAGDFA